MEQQIDKVSSPSEDPSTPKPKDLTTHDPHNEALVTEGYGPPSSLQQATRSTSSIASPAENQSQQSFISQTDKGILFYINIHK